MGHKNKLQRISDIERFSNVYQYSDFGENPELKGKWHSQIFGNNNPITLELACGKGEYSVNLAKKYPDRNFVGVDIKGPRMWVGAKQALEEQIPNVRFLRAFIDHLENYFAAGEVDEMWIVFADPYLKKPKKRLTSPKFLDTYRNIMQPGGTIHLKTDSGVLYDYTLDVIRKQNLELIHRIDDVYKMSTNSELVDIQTYYEKMHIAGGKTIRYARFRL